MRYLNLIIINRNIFSRLLLKRAGFFVILQTKGKKIMAEQEKWQWQEPGRAWKGVGLFHITLTIPDRQPLLGMLDIPDGDPTMTAVRRTPLGNSLVDCLLDIPNHHPEVQVIHFCVMPDHLHAVLYVRRTMPTGIKGMVRGFWQGVKKLGRASSVIPNNIRGNRQEGTLGLQEATRKLEAFAEGLKGQMGDEAYYNLHPVFTEMPFIRPYDAGKRHISRADCVNLNTMAEEFCKAMC